MLFSSEPALLMGCHPGLSQKAASSVGLGINPGIMALMPSWVEAKLFKKYWLPESLSLLFLSPPLSIFCLYLFKLCSPFSALFICHFLPSQCSTLCTPLSRFRMTFSRSLDCRLRKSHFQDYIVFQITEKNWKFRGCFFPLNLCDMVEVHLHCRQIISCWDFLIFYRY